MAILKRWDPATGPLQLTTLRQCLEREGMITAWWSDVPGTNVPEHSHPFPETRWVLSGFLQVTAAGQAFDLGPGDRLDLPAGTPHASQVLGLAPVIYVTGTTEKAMDRAV